MIKAVFIDIDDTLLDFGKCAEYAMRECFCDFGLKFDSFMFPVFKEINAKLWLSLEKGEITKNELYGKRWVTVLSEFGITHIDGDEFERHFQKHISDSAEKVDGAEKILKYLSLKYKLYAASNGPHEQQIGRLEKANLLRYFNGVFTSEKLGAQKPEKAFFNAAFKASESTAAESVIIGDSLSADIFAGEMMNITTIWFNRKNCVNTSSVSPDFTVCSLSEIKNII